MKNRIKILCLNIATVFLLHTPDLAAQNTELKYSLIMNGSSMGILSISRKCLPDQMQISLESKAKKRFIISFEIYEMHTEVFKNNVMTTASVFRQVNGKTKMNTRMNFTGTNCVIASEGKTNSISLNPVSWSVLNLYFTEPVNINEVFSDSFQQMLKIDKMENHIYRLQLPDGNTNIFYYANGVCTKEIINHSFYKIELVPAK
jgi:hypothetical protein